MTRKTTETAKDVLVLATVLLWVPLSAAAQPATPEMIPVEDLQLEGRAAPDFTLPTLDGGTVALADLRGKPVILSFWASWCGPCRHEMPALVQYQDDHPDVHVITINVDRDTADARRFLQSVQSDLPVGLDNDAAVASQYLVTSMPQSVVIDRNGTVKLVKLGYGTKDGLTEIDNAVRGL